MCASGKHLNKSMDIDENIKNHALQVDSFMIVVLSRPIPDLNCEYLSFISRCVFDWSRFSLLPLRTCSAKPSDKHVKRQLNLNQICTLYRQGHMKGQFSFVLQFNPCLFVSRATDHNIRLLTICLINSNNRPSIN